MEGFTNHLIGADYNSCFEDWQTEKPLRPGRKTQMIDEPRVSKLRHHRNYSKVTPGTNFWKQFGY